MRSITSPMRLNARAFSWPRSELLPYWGKARVSTCLPLGVTCTTVVSSPEVSANRRFAFAEKCRLATGAAPRSAIASEVASSCRVTSPWRSIRSRAPASSAGTA